MPIFWERVRVRHVSNQHVSSQTAFNYPILCNTLMMKISGLIFLGLISLCLVSGYAWSERLVEPSELVLDHGADAEDHGADAEDSVEDTKSDEIINQEPEENDVLWKPSSQNLEEEVQENDIHELDTIR